MSTVTQKLQSSSQQLIDTHIGATRRALKLVDLFAGLLTLTIGLLVFLFTAALLEHWIIAGGWSLAARSVLFLLMVGGVVWYGWRTFWPLLQMPINPVYAAQTLEKSSPVLKNSLLSLLLFRSHRQQLSPKVYQTIEQQAAARLSQIPLDTAVDRAVVLRLGYVLVGVVAIFALYSVLSPKNPMISASRILFPWSPIGVPSRVQITDIRPGEVSLARGDRLTVTANVHGMGADEQTILYYQSGVNIDAADRTEPLSILMLRPSNVATTSIERQCQLPGASYEGVEQDLQYWVEAGDARSATYQIHVFARPTMVVKRVRYDYPAYTGYPSREVGTTGDLDALEGTRVTLFGLSNQPIQEASVDFHADGRHDLAMQILGDSNARDRAQAQFTLALRSDRRTPRYASYVLRFTTPTGQSNRQPPKYRIAVTPDYAPEIRLLESEKGEPEETVQLSVDRPITVQVEASDPDFALSEVRIVGHLEQAGVNPQENPSAETVRLNQVLLGKNHTGRFLGRTVFTLGQLDLHEGEVLVYWAEARDNRTPDANVSITSPRRVRAQSTAQGDSEQPENRPGQPGSPTDDHLTEESTTDQADGDNKNRQPGEQSQDTESAEDRGEGGQSGESGERGESGGSASGEQGESGASEGSESGDESGERGESGGESGEQGESGASEGSENGGSESGELGENGGSENGGSENADRGERTHDRGAGGSQNREGEDDQAGTTQQQDGASEAGTEAGAEAGANREGTGKQQAQELAADEPGSAQERVSSDGDDDGTAFERLLQHLAEQEAEQDPTGEDGEAQSPGASGEKSSEQGEAGAGDSQSDQQTGASSDQERKPSDKQSDRQGGESPDDQQAPSVARDQRESDSQGGQQGDRSGGGDRGAGQQADSEGTGSAGQHHAADEGSGQSEQPGAGQIGSRPGDTQSSAGKKGNSAGEKGSSAGEKGSSAGDQGNPSESDQGQSEQGQSDQGQSDQGQSDQGQSERGQSDQGQSDAGNQSGDSSDGQTDNRPSEQQSDQPDTASEQPGNSSATSPSANGQPSNQPSSNELGSSEVTNPSSQPEAKSSSQDSPEQNSPAQDRPTQDSPSQGTPSAQEGGSTGGSSGTIPPATEQEVLDGDAANLDYARQQTDLVLNRLSDQFKRQQVDPKMLDKLGWTQEQLQQFLQRWKNFKSLAAGTDDQAQSAQTELDAALRSLGLRKDRRLDYDSNRTKDNQRDLRDTYRSRVPAALVERMRAYLKGTNKSQQGAEGNQ